MILPDSSPLLEKLVDGGLYLSTDPVAASSGSAPGPPLDEPSAMVASEVQGFPKDCILPIPIPINILILSLFLKPIISYVLYMY